MDFLAHNMPAGEFSELTGIPVDTLRDWRKRGIGASICQPHPNGNGRWVYSQQGGMIVHLAQRLVAIGWEWKLAMDLAYFAAAHLTGKALYGSTPNAGGYGDRYIVFARASDGASKLFSGPDASRALEAWAGDLDFPMVEVIDLDAIMAELPARFRKGLDTLKEVFAN
ncbi:MerR family transcriptional regulator [Wenxinia marina]|uniref:Putative transcriptional regulator n=1 Tax=Wenxinia marina DSM 24838 TaxID=1123501 RepID=A0A0D0Q8P0_9RHOB|nr:MerR family transcriptional regulator [Wenxinia marina]KIQ70754.1 putative transcriptional regulator [Wenxinia marina DSM 24838]GGL80414.1 hypothetical protein GCM10011392_38770 [Wenxinia marina]